MEEQKFRILKVNYFWTIVGSLEDVWRRLYWQFFQFKMVFIYELKKKLNSSGKFRLKFNIVF